MKLVEYAQALRQDIAPSFVMDSVPIDMATAARCISGDMEATKELVDGINASITRLDALGVTTIAVPCNSVHALFHTFIKPSGIDVLHIADPVTAQLQEGRIQRVGFLASGMTIESGIYTERLSKAGILPILPIAGEQQELNGHISRFVATGIVDTEAKAALKAIIHRLEASSIDSLVLACTDLRCMLDKSRLVSRLPLADSLDALAKECARRSFLHQTLSPTPTLSL
jgi:aspartate racemase